MNSHFLAFCNEPIYANKGVYNIRKRMEIIYDLSAKGIIPLLESAGYQLNIDKNKLSVRLLKVLWTLSRKKRVIPLADNLEYHKEHLQTYEFRLNEDTWNNFWKQWGISEDFEQDYIHSFKWLVPSLLWSWMDISQCSMTEEIEYYVQEEDGLDMGTKRRDDPYLLDTSQVDYQDRHKF